MCEHKLGSIVNRVRSDYAFSARMANCVYRNRASLCHFRDGQQVPFTEPVESALQSISLSNQADRDWSQRQAVACLEALCIQDSGGVGVVVVVQEVHFGYHGRILPVALTEAQWSRQHEFSSRRGGSGCQAESARPFGS